MPTPSTRTPIKIARGTYSNLNASVSDIQEGEICYATDQDKLYVKEGGSLVNTQDDNTKAAINSPTFTGTPAAPTAGSGTNTTQIATTEFVTTAVAGVTPGASTSAVNTWTAGQRGEITTLTDGATITPNFNDSNNFTVTLGGTRTMADPTNITAGQSGSIFILQDGTGGRQLSWGTAWEWPGGTIPTLSSAASSCDRVDYICRTTGSIHAVFTGAYS